MEKYISRKDEKVLRDSLQEVMDFCYAYMECHLYDEKVIEEETDAELLKRNLPLVREWLNNQEQEEKKSNELMKEFVNDCSDDIKGKLKNLLFMVYKTARERVNPNYKYVVVNADITTGYLSDNYEQCLQKAKDLSLLEEDFMCVLEIQKSRDGSYKTIKDCYFYNGQYYQGDKYKTFLHFDFIAQRVGKLEKL